MDLAITKIRKEVFGVNQTVFAEIAGVSQATVSKWDSGKAEPRLSDLARIRSAAKGQRKRWKDSYFFDL